MDPPCILIPSLDDWESLAALLPALDASLAAAGRRADVLLIDDGSTQPPDALGRLGAFRALGRVEIVHLLSNLGHQRAIAVGLSLRAARGAASATVVMDADGEDRPEHVADLLDALDRAPGGARGRGVVFAQRRRRQESLSFRALYRVYRLVQRAATGVTVDVGNFAAVGAGALRALAVRPSLWNHFPATVLASRLAVGRVPLDRGRRLAGRSRLRLSGLVVHGLSAMSVFGERVGLRVLAACGAVGLAALAGIAVIVAVRLGLGTAYATPGWATSAAGLLLVLLAQLGTIGASFTFTHIAGRDAARVLPIRDHAHYIDRVLAVRPAADGVSTGGDPADAEPGWLVHVRRDGAGPVRARPQLEGVLGGGDRAVPPGPGAGGGRRDGE